MKGIKLEPVRAGLGAESRSQKTPDPDATRQLRHERNGGHITGGLRVRETERTRQTTYRFSNMCQQSLPRLSRQRRKIVLCQRLCPAPQAFDGQARLR